MKLPKLDRKIVPRIKKRIQTSRRPMAAMTMCWNEACYLRKWVEYYGENFGRKNLYILAHGGDSVVHEIARGCNVYDLPRNVIDGSFERKRARLIEGFMAFLLGEHRALIFGDVDEYIVADPSVGTLGGLVDRYAKGRPSVKPLNLNVLDDPSAGVLDYAAPIFGQRTLARTRYQFCKPVVMYQPASFVGGFHYSTHEPHVEKGLYLAHLHYADRATNEQIARDRLGTFAQQPGLETAHQRKRNAWIAYMERYENYISRAEGLPIRPLDDVAPELIERMRDNIEFGHQENPGKGKTMTYGKMNMNFRIEIPSRFASVF